MIFQPSLSGGALGCISKSVSGISSAKTHAKSAPPIASAALQELRSGSRRP